LLRGLHRRAEVGCLRRDRHGCLVEGRAAQHLPQPSSAGPRWRMKSASPPGRLPDGSSGTVPATAQRIPIELVTTSSSCCSLTTPCATRYTASRKSAACSRLATKPGISFASTCGRLPMAR
jgi:hypothetical protein